MLDRNFGLNILSGLAGSTGMSGFCIWLEVNGDNLVKLPLPLIVTGSSGRIGRLLQIYAQDYEEEGLLPFWTARNGLAGASEWEMISGQVPLLPVCGFLLHLAAALPSRSVGASLKGNLEMAQAVLKADRTAAFAHVFFLSTVAVYAPQSTAIAETVVPDPKNDYGRAKYAAEEILRAGLKDRLTILRLANLAGADALLGSEGEVVLDPVENSYRGPVRSYIGPGQLMTVLRQLMRLRARGQVLPATLNIALPGAVAMADLLDAAARRWRFGPPRPGVVARVEVEVSRLAGLVPLTKADAKVIVADLKSVRGGWQ